MFQERAASARAHDHSWLGAANRCLVVALTKDRLIVRPTFPFNLFIPQKMGLDVEVRLPDVLTVTAERYMFREWLRLGLRVAGQSRELSVQLKDPEGFVAAFGKLRAHR